MITNKDLSIDRENGKITLNGNKYDLGTQGEIDTVVKDVYSVMGQNGAKNLIPYPYNGTTQVDHGVTFTVNNDGTVIANGTANGIAQLYLVLGDVALSAAGNLVINTNKPLFLSGCPSGGGNTTYRIQYGLTDGTTYWAKTASDTGRGVKITPVAGLNSYCFVVIKIMVFDGCTVNNLTFKPMLRLASDTDNTYQQYAKTNRQLTEVIGDLSQTGITGASVAAQLGSVHSLISMINDLPPVATTTPADIPTGIRIHFNIESQTAGYPLGNALYVSIKIAESRCVQILFENGAATPEGKYRTVLNSTTWSDWKAF